jgi:Pyruvate/2-oxoacid:ferredoxin oxidoreductase gamma subunit
LSCIIAGNAGKRIGTAANAFSLGGVLSGLWMTKRDDYPITVKTGFSLSEVILSPEETYFTGITKPDLMVVLFPEGLKKIRGKLGKLTEKDALYINAALSPIETRARIVQLDFGKTKMRQEYYALMAMAEVLRQTKIYPLEAYLEAASLYKDFAEGNLTAIDASEKLSQNE